MAKLNNPSPKIVSPITCLLDTNVIINWLTKEEDATSNKTLWEAPHKIIGLIEEGKIKGLSTLINLLEIRFVLRRKKKTPEERIKEDIEKLTSLFEVMVPDEICLIRANQLQVDHPLDPFDAITLATALSIENIVFISRDNQLLNLASKFIDAFTPELFLAKL